MRNPDTIRFSKTHEWLDADGTVGISDHAQREITDVVFVDLPKVGKEVKVGDAVCVVESVKAAFDIYSPVSGKIAAVNDKVAKEPGLVNQSPYDEGWLFRVEKSSPAEGGHLMAPSDYQKFLETDHH